MYDGTWDKWLGLRHYVGNMSVSDFTLLILDEIWINTEISNPFPVIYLLNIYLLKEKNEYWDFFNSELVIISQFFVGFGMYASESVTILLLTDSRKDYYSHSFSKYM